MATPSPNDEWQDEISSGPYIRTLAINISIVYSYCNLNTRVLRLRLLALKGLHCKAPKDDYSKKRHIFAGTPAKDRLPSDKNSFYLMLRRYFPAEEGVLL